MITVSSWLMGGREVVLYILDEKDCRAKEYKGLVNRKRVKHSSGREVEVDDVKLDLVLVKLRIFILYC